MLRKFELENIWLHLRRKKKPWNIFRHLHTPPSPRKFTQLRHLILNSNSWRREFVATDNYSRISPLDSIPIAIDEFSKFGGIPRAREIGGRINRRPQRILLYRRGFSSDLRLKGAELDPSTMKILADQPCCE